MALPIMVTLVATVWTAQWSRNKPLDDIVKRLDRIEKKPDDHEVRITRVEERTAPPRHQSHLLLQRCE